MTGISRQIDRLAVEYGILDKEHVVFSVNKNIGEAVTATTSKKPN